MYQVVSVRKFADAYARSDAGVAQTEALLKPFKCTVESDRALAWTKFALTGMLLLIFLDPCAIHGALTLSPALTVGSVCVMNER